jgi:hypothetical protein
MTVTDITPDVDPTDALVGRIRDEIIAAIAKPDLSAVHEVIRQAGIRNARRALAEAPDRLAEAQAAFREAQGREALAKEGYAQALLEAEWELDGQLHKDGNKTYRWVNCECVAVTHDATNCPVCNGAGKVRKFMLADDVKSWKASEAAKVPAVVELGGLLRRAEMDTAAARDSVLVSEKRLSACRADLEAAVAELNALSIGLSAKGA